jgi:predicted acyl esterase
MKKWGLVLIAAVAIASPALAGIFTTHDTLIRVPADATSTDSGDTGPNGTDTIHLDARVYIPDGVSAPAPVVVIIHGYGASKTTGTVVTIAQDFAAAGYVVLTPTMRGFGDSDGLVTLAGPNEINDLKTIITDMQTGTIGDTPAVAIPVNSSSKFGVTGASYGGGHSWEIMRTHVAGLTAVAPVIGWTDLYQSLAPNNVTKLGFDLALFASGFDTNMPNYDDVMFNWADDMLSGHPEDIRTGGHTRNIDWRSVIFNPTELTVPAFVIQGWNDWLFPAEQATDLFQTPNTIPFFKMYIGGIGHPRATTDITVPEAVYLRQQVLSWFDYWLKGIDNGIENEPRVTIGPEKTVNFSQATLIQSDTFPLAGTTSTTYYVNGGGLSTTVATKGKPRSISANTFPAVLQPIQNALGGSASGLIQAIIAVNNSVNSGGGIEDPNIDTGFDDGANSQTYVTGPLAQNTHVVGRPDFQLFVSAKRANAYYYAELVERDANGVDHLVSRAAIKDTSSGFSTPHEIDFSAFGVNRVFEAGNRIGLRIASRDYPFFLVNANQPTIKFYRRSPTDSNMTLPIVP